MTGFELAGKAEAPRGEEKESTCSTYEPELIRVPAGKFQMGERAELHELELPAYLIGKYPVTNSAYLVFVKDMDHPAPIDWKNNLPEVEKSDHPVVNVSWQDAMAYCSWLAEKTGRPYTLPSEAEWEKAARGDEDARYFPWGSDFDKSRCNTEEARIRTTSPVGQFSPQGDSMYGCVDMSGNVWEWTRSHYKEYPYNAGDGREDLTVGDDVFRVLRGGSFFDFRDLARVSFRGRYGPDKGDYYFGFRVALPDRPESA